MLIAHDVKYSNSQMNPSTTLNLKQILEPISEDLAVLDQRLLDEICPSSFALSSILQEIFKAGGKRIRPALSFLVYRLLNPQPTLDQKIFLVAEISELIHTASLVHDDIIDNSLIRRGKPTTNSRWNNAITVISGDFMFAQAAVNLGKIGINSVTELYAKVLSELCAGEIKQVEQKFSTNVDWDYYYQKTYNKTASLFEASCVAAALILDYKDTSHIASYGKNLGMAFQLIDDILDYQSNSVELGKPILQDLQDGQITLALLYTLESLKGNARKALECKIAEIQSESNPEIKEKQAREVYKIIRETGSLTQSLNKVKEFAEKARQSLNDFPNNHYKQSLLDLVDFTIQRIY